LKDISREASVLLNQFWFLCE